MTQQSHPNATDLDDEELSVEEDEVAAQSVPIEPYTIDDIIADGCFLERESIVKIITQLRHKKNIILQCPPGTGKTWLAKKLAYALMGQKDENSLRAVQFHPNLSYEDFVRGWRPSGEGKLTLVDGPFLEIINEAKKDASIKHVVVIEEINRGNSAQILGEMLTLLEADKRTPSEALELSYRRTEGERIHIPANLYVIGTMNIADRSLALVDLALRR
ncbi:TPA: McrB family protein, partial [Vibrio parahaemolyticus]